jgi:hypothetical protein
MWNPRLRPGRASMARLNRLGTQPPRPQSGIEEAQGFLYPPDLENWLQIPQAMGVNLQSFVNPYSLTLYQYQVSTTQPLRVIPPNLRRCYLIIQNQGPGNLYINFGQDVTLATAVANSNGMQLIQTQIYEQIGGGGVDPNGNTVTECFVSPDYVSAITDTAGTTIMVGEGIWRYVTAAGQSL